MVGRVKRFIDDNKLIENDDIVILGVSGGADSICLLCVLSEIYKGTGVRLVAVHINHLIRETAERDQEYVRSVCEKLGIEFELFKYDVIGYAEEHHLSTEEAGRILRYNAFSQVGEKYCNANSNFKIAVAHNMNDNGETMLLNMFRGTGINGLKGIEAKRDNVIRPLIAISREEIETYLEENNIPYCVDETNLEDDYARNKVRHHLLPVACEINSNAIDRLYSLSSQISEAEDYLNMVAEEAYKKICVYSDGDSVKIAVGPAKELHPYILKRVLLDVLGEIASTRKDIGQIHVNMVYELFEMQVGKKIDLPYDMCAIKEYECVSIYKKAGSKEVSSEPSISDLSNDSKIELFIDNSSEKSLVVDFSQKYRFAIRVVRINEPVSQIPKSSYTKWFDYDKIIQYASKLEFRYREEGDSIVINDKGGQKSLKKYFVDEKIPSSERQTIPLVALGSHIIWVVEKRISAAFKITDSTENILEIKLLED